MSYYCLPCDRSFISEHALDQHLKDSIAHAHICMFCNNEWPNSAALVSHMAREHYGCSSCRGFFETQEDRQQHEWNEHLYCAIHRRYFQSASNLRAHLNSVPHIGRTIPCVCNSSFPIISAIFLHIEKNGCNNITPHLLHHTMMLMADRHNHLISEGKSKLFEFPANTLEKWITEYSFNTPPIKNQVGYYCFGCSTTFDKQTALMFHLYRTEGVMKSGYRCLYCDSKFSKASGLLQHRESGSCDPVP